MLLQRIPCLSIYPHNSFLWNLWRRKKIKQNYVIRTSKIFCYNKVHYRFDTSLDYYWNDVTIDEIYKVLSRYWVCSNSRSFGVKFCLQNFCLCKLFNIVNVGLAIVRNRQRLFVYKHQAHLCLILPIILWYIKRGF